MMTMVSVHPESELVNRVERALDQIRPYMEADGGNVKSSDYGPFLVTVPA